MRMTNVAEALAWVPRCGGPPLNLLVGDRAGQIGWTILGYLPQRVGFDGGLPTSWADGSRHWDGYVRPEDHPHRGSPKLHRIWSANQRKLDPKDVPYAGDDDVDLGARAKQIRDDLLALEQSTPAAMLAIQTDNRALFLAHWQKLLAEVARKLSTKPHDPEIEPLLKEAENWGARAATNSVGFRLVNYFRDEVIPLALEPVIKTCGRVSTNYIYFTPHTEEAIWRVLTERPAHLLSPRFENYDLMLETALTNVLVGLRKINGPLSDRTWGEVNFLRIQHPFSHALPALSRWLDVPGGQMPGDYNNMPSILNPIFGASERLVVSPGHEAEGYLHMPTGESGHFLSPYFRAGTDAWREMKPLPFLPGTPEHTLTLNP
jgi:penicillin G amidase